MKKALSMLLASAMVLSLTACGGSKGSGSSTAETTAVQINQAVNSNNSAANSVNGTAAAAETTLSAEERAEIAKDKKKELVVGSPTEPDAFVPFNSVYGVNSNDDNIMTQNIYENCYTLMPDGSIEPRTAKSITISEDGLDYIIDFRDDIKFCTGEPLLMEDILWSLDKGTHAQESEANPDPTKERRLSSYFLNLESIEQTGDWQVTMHFSQVNNQALKAGLASRAICFMDKSLYEEIGLEEYYAHPVGTGPYMLTDYFKTSYQTYEINPYYYGDKPVYEKITLKFLTDANTQMLALENGEIDVLTNASLDGLLKLDPNGSIKFEAASSNSVLNLQFNLQSDLMKNENFRKAVAASVNRDDYIMAIYNGYSQPADMVACKYYTGYPDEGTYTKPIEYSIDAAKQYLKDAGYNGEEFIIRCQQGTKAEQAAVILQGALITAGVQCTVKVLDGATNNALGKTLEGWHAFMVVQTSTAMDCISSRSQLDNNYLKEMGQAATMIDDPEWNGLWAQADITPDGPERRELFAKIVTIMNEKAYDIPICEDLNSSGYHDYVAGVVSRPARGDYRFAEWY